MKRLGIVTLLLLAVPSQFMQAKDVTVGPQALKVPPPPGFCELQDELPSDAPMLNGIRGALSGNRLLVMYANCSELTDWRTGKRPLLDNFVQYQTLSAWENQPLPASPAETLQQTCAYLRQQGEKLVAEKLPDMKAKIEQNMRNIKLNEMRFLGLLEENATACYGGILQKLQTQIGTEKVQSAVFAVTVAKGKIIYYYVFAPYVDDTTVFGLLEKQKSNVQAFLTANGAP